MNNYNDTIPVIKKIYELYKNFYLYSKLFPKKDKYTLGSRCEITSLKRLRLCLVRRQRAEHKKLSLIKKANVKFDALKVFIRLANDVKMIDDKKYLALQKQIQEIGRMIGGWQRSLN